MTHDYFYLYAKLKAYKEKGNNSVLDGIMKNLKERVGEVSHYLQHLMDPAVFPEVQNAVEKKDKDLLIEVCRKMKVPEIYTGAIVSMLLSMSARQKWIHPF